MITMTTLAVALVVIGSLGLSLPHLGIPMSSSISALAVGGALLSLTCLTLFVRSVCGNRPVNPQRPILPPRFPAAQPLAPANPQRPIAPPAHRIEGVDAPLPDQRSQCGLPQPRTLSEELGRSYGFSWYHFTLLLLQDSIIVRQGTLPPDGSAIDCHDRLFIPVGPRSAETRPYIIVSDNNRDAISTPGFQCSPVLAKQHLNDARAAHIFPEVERISQVLLRRYRDELNGSFATIVYSLLDRVIRSCRQTDDEGLLLDRLMDPRDPSTLDRCTSDPEILPRLARITAAHLLRRCTVLSNFRLRFERGAGRGDLILTFGGLEDLERGNLLPNALMDNPEFNDREQDARGDWVETRGLCLLQPFFAAQKISRLPDSEFYAFLEAIRQGDYSQLDDDFLRVSQLIMNVYLNPYIAAAIRGEGTEIENGMWDSTLNQHFQTVDPYNILGNWAGGNCYFACCLAQLTAEEANQFGTTTQSRLNRMRQLTGQFMNTPNGTNLLGAGPLLTAARTENAQQAYASDVVMRALAHVLGRPVHIYYGERRTAASRMRGVIREGLLQPDMIFNAESDRPPILVLTGVHCLILRPRAR